MPVVAPGQKTHDKWNYVYDNNRLQLIRDSVTVVGLVKNITAEVDGDLHIQLRVDSVYLNLLNKRNFIKQDSCLVIELVCINESPFIRCNGYINDVIVPDTGDIIEVLGAYIFDKRHRWMEIHPVYSLKIIYSKYR